MFSLTDFEAHAKEVLDKNAWDYYSSGANQEQTLRDNTEAFARYRLRPQVLRDVSKIDMRTQLFGEWVQFPICVSPTAMQRMAHPEGEVATARGVFSMIYTVTSPGSKGDLSVVPHHIACSKLGTCMTLSTWSTTSLEEVASCSSGLKWYQLYVYNDKEVTRSLIHRAEKAGYKALVITVDTPILGHRLADARNKFTLPPHLTLANFTDIGKAEVEDTHDSWLQRYVKGLIDPSLNWHDIDWVRGITDLPIVLKGILTSEDAVEAVKHGVQGIVVSNHGARQLDGVPATIDVLSEVVEAVGDKVEVFLDGGVRQGTDVLKAVALGAKAVFIGRPVLWGLAYKGSEGVENVLTILREELKLAMMLAGCAKLSDITSGFVVHESRYKMIRHLPQSRL